MKWSIPSSMIDEGRKLVAEHRVLEVLPNIDHKQWHGLVLTDKLYNVILDATPKENDHCQCETFNRYHYCAHTIACELFLKEEGFERVITSNKDYSALLNQNVIAKEHLVTFDFDDQTHTPEPLNLYLYLKYENGQGAVSFKVSQKNKKRKYLIKDISQWKACLFEKKPLKLGQNQWWITEQSFSKQERKYLKQLWPFLEVSQTKNKWLNIPPTTWMSLVRQLNKSHQLNINDEDISLKALSLPLPLALNLSLEEQRLKLTLTTTERLETLGKWILTKQGYYTLNATQYKSIQALRQLFLKNNTLYFEIDAFKVLIQSVIPKLKGLIDLNWEPSLIQKIEQYPLEIHLLAKGQDSLILIPSFYYGKYHFMLDDDSHPFVIRNDKKERELYQICEHFGYEQQGIQFVKAMTKKNLYHFFEVEKPYLESHYVIRLDETLEKMGPHNQDFQPSLSIDVGSRWLEVHFDVSGITSQDLQPLMESIQKNDHFFTTAKGEMIDLRDEVFDAPRQTLKTFKKEIDASGRLRLPIYKALMLEEKTKGVQSDRFKQLILDLKHRHCDMAFLHHLPITLRPYQEEGVSWLKMLSNYQLGGILADDMGLGKTLQVIAYLLSEKEEGYMPKALILAPASVIYNWQAEVKQFAPSLSCKVIFGNKKERQSQIQNDCDLMITSYASFRQDVEEYMKKDYSVLILDEAQMVKNSTSQTFKDIQKLDITRRFALSGTPVENCLEELWSIFQLIMPGFFPGKKAFKKLEPKFIAKMIQPFVLRRTKEEVLSELPERSDINYYSLLTSDQKAIYLAYLTQMQQEVSTMDTETFSKNKIPILAGLTRLRQICCTPSLFDKNYTGQSGKIELLKTLLIQAKESHRRILLFSQFTTMLDILKPVLKHLGLHYFELTGHTKTNERLKQVEAFNRGEGDIFLISLKAGGTGLNLTGADTVILFDSWWNPAVEEQAAGRAHRMGQKKNVEVWHFIAEGTIEERIYELQQKKRDLFERVMTAEDRDQLSKLSEEDIRYLLTYEPTEGED